MRRAVVFFSVMISFTWFPLYLDRTYGDYAKQNLFRLSRNPVSAKKQEGRRERRPSDT